MKYLTVLTALLLGATASPIKQRETAQAKISNFSASTNANGDGATIEYDVDIAGVVKTHCIHSDPTSGSKLPDVGLTACDNPVIRWQFRQDPSPPGSEGRYRIVVIYAPASGPSASGFHEWAPSDFPQKLLDSETETVYQVSTPETHTILTWLSCSNPLSSLPKYPCELLCLAIANFRFQIGRVWLFRGYVLIAVDDWLLLENGTSGV
ncbi:hypothetical protein GGR55DRAFT_72654 [Xylaria sp. FL0064]|nr:hypothetical protein GGR55DRAFT_72654 [Xylaria sp. FL0064]